MLPRTLLPLSLSLALTWAGAAQAADHAAWPALSQPAGRGEGRSGDSALVTAGETHILVVESGLASGILAADAATSAAYSTSRLTSDGDADPGPGLAAGRGTRFTCATYGGADCPSVDPRGCR